MYSLMILLSLLATAAFLHAFVYGRRRYLPIFGVLLALVLYTHNWGLFFTAGSLVALLPCLWRSPDRRAFLKDALIAFGLAFLIFAPWLPTLIFQAQHTGAPWAKPPRFGAPIQISRVLLGGDRATVALLLAGGAGWAAAFQLRRRHDRLALAALLTVPGATLATAWLVSQISPAWTTRYLAAIVGPLLLLAGGGLARAGRLGLVALALVVFFWGLGPRAFNADAAIKSNAEEVAVTARERLMPGDLVVSTHPEQVPLLRFYMLPGLRYATTLGPTRDPQVMDWREALPRLRRATPERALEPLLDELPVGRRVLLVRPITKNPQDWGAPWTRLVRRRSAQWGAALAGDRRFERVAVVPRFYRGVSRIGVRAVLYRKVRARPAGR